MKISLLNGLTIYNQDKAAKLDHIYKATCNNLKNLRYTVMAAKANLLTRKIEVVHKGDLDILESTLRLV